MSALSTKMRNLPLLLTLTVGILSFVLLSTLEKSIQSALSSRARALLGADLSLSSRRWISDSELDRARKALSGIAPPGESVAESEVIEIYSMAAVEGRTPQLVQVVAVGPEYPLVGRLEFEAPCPSICVFGDPTIALRWKLEAGRSRIRIGERSFLWGGRILSDSSRSLKGGSLAPQVVMRREHLASTGLLRSGSTFTVRRHLALPQTPDPRELRRLARVLDLELSDPGIQVQIPEDASADEGRLLSSVSDFLGLTSLVGLVLAFLGCYWLLRKRIQQDAQSWAIYRVLAPRASAADLPLLRSCLGLALGAAALALVIAQLAWMWSAPRLSQLLLMEGTLGRSLSPGTILQAASLAIGTMIAALIPSLRFLRRQPLVELLRNPGILAQKTGFLASDLLGTIVLLWLSARWIAHSWWAGSLFLAGLLIAAAVVWGLGMAGLAVLERMAASGRMAAPVRLTGLALARLRSGTLLLWTTFALGALLITLVPLLEKTLSRQISAPEGAGPVPSLFLFDIQEEQLEPLRSWADTRGTRLEFTTPLIRGRLLEVNGAPFEKLSDAPTTREEEREARFRNRGFNLTYRDALTPSETLVAGRNFEAAPPPERNSPDRITPEKITVEKRFADRLKLKIGDRLRFDIQGVPILAEIVGLRQVQWTSFQPNFFIVFEPRALVDAPKTFLASLPRMPVERREQIQRELFEAFPNISTIDVTELMRTLLEGFSQISAALLVMAALSVVAGAAAVLSVASLRARERLSELQLLKLLGMHPRALVVSVSMELGALACAAAVTGMLLASALAGALSRFVFQVPGQLMEWPTAGLSLGIAAGFLLGGTLLGFLASRKAALSPPALWLRALVQET